MTIVVLTVIITVLLFVLSYWVDDANLYKYKYKWYSDQYAKARHELSKAQKEIQLIKQEQQTKAKQITINVNVDTDEVVSKVMQGVDKKKEQVYIKVDGKEMNINEVTKAMKKVGSNMK